MIQKLTYEELEQRIQELTKEAFERKRTEAALEVSETRYRRLFETAQDGILILDADTERIDDANPFILNMLGFSLEEIAGKKLWKLDHSETLRQANQLFWSYRKKNIFVTNIYRLKQRTGVLLP
jgi:PAS domain S-box-containing protein